MKPFLTFSLIALYCVMIRAQIDPNTLLGIPKATTSEIATTPTPLTGSIVYDTDLKNTFQYDGTTWQPLGTQSQAIVLNRSTNGNNNLLVNANNRYFDMPLNDTHEITNTGAAFRATGQGEITILKDGTYLISAALSSSDMPSGNTKYILAAFINGTLRGYLSRGVASLPNRDFWGTSGILMYPLNQNDVVNIRYVLNNSGNPLDAVFVNIGITKI